ncbi:MAG: energy-coupling factor transporter transmembrane protein EcfT [Candidatus Krumholzibacteria bacterium]|nr:energy-coupling factor transporter transmembrane protein EcfT [Candidatus Krumholzibacteria bacterium]
MAFSLMQYNAGDSFLHRLHPLAKLLVAVLASVSAFVFEPWIVPAALAAGLILLHAARSIAFGRLLAVLKPLPFFIAIIVLANVFLAHRDAAWWRGAEAGLVQALRVVALILAVNLFLAATDAVDLSDSVLRIMGPLARFGIRVGELSLMTMITFSFIPLMADEARRLQLAQAVRCGFPKRGVGAVRAAIPLLAPLVVGLFRRADEIDLALRARCYRLNAPRSSLSRAGFGRIDCLVCAASVALFTVGLYAQF